MHDSFRRSIRLQRLAAWVQENPDRELTRDQAARLLGMAPASFSRFFRDRTGVAYSRWLARRRVEKAKHLLRETNASVLEVAERTGFGSTRTLERWFARREGVTPLEYRNGRGEPPGGDE